jgi:hypothetical protein
MVGYELEGIIGTYVSGNDSGELVDFEIMRFASMSHWSTEQYSRYDHFMQYLQQQWNFDAVAAELGTELLTKLPWNSVCNTHAVVHPITKQDLLRCVDNQLEHISSAERSAVVKVIELVCWFAGDEHPLTTYPTQEAIELALERTR